MNRKHRNQRGFTLIELIAVIVVLAILAGVALPKYFDYAAQAKESATKGTLGGVRAAVASYYANQAFNGTPGYPTLVQLTTVGTVLQEILPENPYTSPKSAAVRDADGTWSAAAAVQAVVTTGGEGWAYDETAGKFWANTATVTENGW
jgi:prepilin-type N-terminal cleavage/methylation domain-containing protein